MEVKGWEGEKKERHTEEFKRSQRGALLHLWSGCVSAATKCVCVCIVLVTACQTANSLCGGANMKESKSVSVFGTHQETKNELMCVNIKD